MNNGGLPLRLQHFLLSILQNKSLRLYQNAIGHFKDELDARSVSWAALSEDDKDIFLAEYFIDLKEAGAKRQGCQVLCAALHKTFPRHRCAIARRVLEVWKAEEPVRQAPACPSENAFAMVGAALALHLGGVACAILLCFTGLLRISEALRLTWKDVVFSDGVIILLLGRTKRGHDEKVVLAHPQTVAWLSQFKTQFFTDDATRVCPISYSKVRYWLPRLCRVLRVGDLALTSHSFRRGGASTLLHQGMPLADIAVHGRWASESSCREYLRRGELFMVRFQSAIQPSAWFNIQTLSKAVFPLLSACESC